MTLWPHAHDRTAVRDRELEPVPARVELKHRLEPVLVGDDGRRDAKVADIRVAPGPHAPGKREHVVGCPVGQTQPLFVPREGRGFGGVAPVLTSVERGPARSGPRRRVRRGQPLGVHRDEVAVVHPLPHRPLDGFRFALYFEGRLVVAGFRRRDEDVAVSQPDRLVRKADQPLDVVLRGAVGVGGVLEDHHVVAVRFGKRIQALQHQDAVPHPGPERPRADR